MQVARVALLSGRQVHDAALQRLVLGLGGLGDVTHEPYVRRFGLFHRDLNGGLGTQACAVECVLHGGQLHGFRLCARGDSEQFPRHPVSRKLKALKGFRFHLWRVSAVEAAYASASACGLEAPPLLEPLAVERLYLDNFFSIAKARRDLGYEPLFNTEQAMKEYLPYDVDLFGQMKAAARNSKAGTAAEAPTTV